MQNIFNKKNILRVLSFLPAFMIMIMIFYFSAQEADESTRTSQDFTKTVVSIVDRGFNLSLDSSETEKAIEALEHFIRKLAHFSEYMLFAVTIALPLYCYDVRGYKMILCVEIFCVLYAGSDEFHQLFVKGRSASLVDVLIDGCGSFVGIYVGIFLGFIYSRAKLHNR